MSFVSPFIGRIPPGLSEEAFFSLRRAIGGQLFLPPDDKCKNEHGFAV
jgi:hypothetical protein